MKLTNLNQLIEENQRLKGRWELSPNHELRYKSRDLDEEIAFRGSLLAAEPDALVVSYAQSQSDQKVVRRLAGLAGAWRLDPKNRIVFEVEKEDGKKDTLTFQGTWQVGKSNELIYRYIQQDLKTRRKLTRELTFKGFWDISDKNRLAYWLGAGSNGVFRFRGAFQTGSILAKKGEIRYQAGVEVNGRHKIQDIILFGKWKLSRNLDLSFEIEYEDGKKKVITFGGEYALDGNHRVMVNLKNQDRRPLGLELILTKDFFNKDGEAFLRLLKSLKESRIEAGLKFQW